MSSAAGRMDSPEGPAGEPDAEPPSDGQAYAKPPADGPAALDSLLQFIRWHLQCAREGSLRNLDTELPRLVQAIVAVTGVLAAGEKRGDASCIAAFRAWTIFEGFAEVLRVEASPEPLRLQILQSISILMEGMKLQPSIDFLVSILNPIFELPPHLSSEEPLAYSEEPLAYFVIILKNVALKLNHANVRPLLVPVLEPAGSGAVGGSTQRMQMPMFNCAVGLMLHRDPMVQTAARVAILKVLEFDCPGVRSAIHESIERDFAPLVVRISRCPVEMRELAKGRCQWRRDDTILASWSEEMQLAEAVADLRDVVVEMRLAEAQQDFPVMLYFLPSGERVRFEGIADAAAALGVATHQDREDFADFVRELLNLNVPDITESLYRAGLDASCYEAPLAQATGASLGELTGRGREARGARASDGYKFGDLTRGLLALGKEARGASASDGYRFGDFSRGLSATLGL